MSGSRWPSPGGRSPPAATPGPRWHRLITMLASNSYKVRNPLGRLGLSIEDLGFEMGPNAKSQDPDPERIPGQARRRDPVLEGLSEHRLDAGNRSPDLRGLGGEPDQGPGRPAAGWRSRAPHGWRGSSVSWGKVIWASCSISLLSGSCRRSGPERTGDFSFDRHRLERTGRDRPLRSALPRGRYAAPDAYSRAAKRHCHHPYFPH